MAGCSAWFHFAGSGSYGYYHARRTGWEIAANPRRDQTVNSRPDPASHQLCPARCSRIHSFTSPPDSRCSPVRLQWWPRRTLTRWPTLAGNRPAPAGNGNGRQPVRASSGAHHRPILRRRTVHPIWWRNSLLVWRGHRRPDHPLRNPGDTDDTEERASVRNSVVISVVHATLEAGSVTSRAQRLFPAHRQPLETLLEIRDEAHCWPGKFQFAQLVKDFAEKCAHLYTGKRGPQTRMHTTPEAQVFVRRASNIEAERVGENVRVAVGRDMVDDNLLTGLDVLPAQFDI